MASLMSNLLNNPQSKYLGKIQTASFAHWKFEQPLLLNSFKNFKIPVFITEFFLEDYSDLTNNIDTFLENLYLADQRAAFTESVEQNLYALLLEKFIYRFNYEKGSYDLFLSVDDKYKMWDVLSFSLNISANVGMPELTYVVVAEYQSFRSPKLRDDIKLIFSQNAEMIGISVDEDLLAVSTMVLPLTGKYYFNEKDDIWRSCHFLCLTSWDGYPIRGEFYDWDKSKLNEGKIDQLFLDFSKRTKSEKIQNDSSKLQRLLKIYLEDYSVDDEQYPFLMKGMNSIDDLWMLVSPPKGMTIIIDDNNAIYLAVFHDCLWDDEHGMYFLYDKDLNLIKVDQGSDPYI